MHNTTIASFCVLLFVLSISAPSNAITLADCETERMIDEALYGADKVDSDLDGLSNQLEVQLLKTDPCLKSSDGDAWNDGYDANPGVFNLASTGIPLDVRLAYINQVEVPSGCDGGSTWDPYVDGFLFGVPELGLDTGNLEIVGWTSADFVVNRPNSNSDLAVEPKSGSGYTATGDGITFALDPDLSMWGSGPWPKLNLKFQAMMVDADWINDDSMSFGSGSQTEDILYEVAHEFKFRSHKAVDNYSGRQRDCRTEIGITTKLDITEAAIEAYSTLNQRGGPSGDPYDPTARCSNTKGCVVVPTIPPYDVPSPVAPVDAGTNGEKCDDPILWNPHFLDTELVWEPGCQDD